jgi:hypothetical protein
MSSVMSVLQLDTQNLLGKYVLIYGLHLVQQDGGGYAASFEYMYDTTLPIIDYIAREKRQKIKVMGLGVGQHGVMFKGKAIAVDVFNSMNGAVLQVHHEEIIKFITLRIEPGAGQEALIEFVEAAKKYSVDMMDVYIGEKSKIRKYLYDIGHGGDWEFMHAAPKRKLDSIFLPRKEKDAIREFVRRFQSKEVRREYAHFNIPYKFNVMLYGVPGSGKSSTINAIASELNSDVAIMSFSSEITDTHMIRAMNRLMQLENCKVVVMEDIDCLFNGGRKEGDAHRNSVSLSGLLNILDGVSRAEGLVVCMTTNDIEAIDDAMLRAGRVDLTVKYGYATDDQVREMVEYYFPGAMGMDIDKFCGMIRYKNVTTSMLQQYFFELRGVPDQICASVDKLLGMRVDKASMKRDAEGCDATHSFYS